MHARECTCRRSRLTAFLVAAAFVLQSANAVHAAARLDLLPQDWLDDSGKPLKFAELRGHRVILTMAYATCHLICPMTIGGLERMQQVLDQRGERADIVVVGYDPENDKPAVWRQYRRSHRLGRANWHFLTGSPQGVELLARQLGFDFWKYDEHVMHDSRALVFDIRGALQKALGPDTSTWSDAL
jgi:protein SCO1/2